MIAAIFRWTILLLLIGLLDRAAADTNAPAAATPDPLAPYEHWITGDVLTRNGHLLFRTDKPVRGNSQGDIVMLGLSRNAEMLGPALARSAELKMKVRLFGALIPTPDAYLKDSTVPSVEFMVWKLHAPDDPDILPPGQAITNMPSTVNFTNSDGTSERISETVLTNAAGK